MRRLGIAFIAALVSVPAWAVIPSELPDAGLLLFNPKMAKSTALQVFAESSGASKSMGNIVIQEEAKPSRAMLVHVWEEPNPDAGLFSSKTKKMREVTPLKEYISSNGLVAVFIDEAQGAWLRINNGWIRRADLQRQHIQFVAWKDVYDPKSVLPEFKLPKEKDLTAKNRKIDEIRLDAFYAPVGEVSVYNSAGDGLEIIKATVPLKFAITGYKGDWINVFTVLDSCADSAGKTDYREGTTGWIPKLDNKGKPTLMMTKEPTCN